MSLFPCQLDTMNIELTTNCPLHCPQCYCTLTGGKNLPLETAIYWIQEAAKVGVKYVMLSGGETLCYPHLQDVVRTAHTYCGFVNVALSGYLFSQEVFDSLLEAGVSGIYISLNGSTKEVNTLSRDGFDLAISALELLQKNHYSNTTINWVMHSSNSDDFNNILVLAEKYDVANLTIMALKPDSKHTLSTLPSFNQMLAVRDCIRNYRGPVNLLVESCYSPMLALVRDTKLFGNMNRGKHMGCSAGRNTFTVNVDGLLEP